MLVTSLVLQYYDVSKPAVIQCDASSSGIGACIMQEGNPVEYASKTMTPTERDTFARSKKRNVRYFVQSGQISYLCVCASCDHRNRSQAFDLYCREIASVGAEKTAENAAATTAIQFHVDFPPRKPNADS